MRAIECGKISLVILIVEDQFSAVKMSGLIFVLPQKLIAAFAHRDANCQHLFTAGSKKAKPMGGGKFS
jgi:hypothetical protein